MFKASIFLLAIILTLAWLARPRWRQRTWRRWGFNFAAITFALISISCVGAWVRSYFVSEQWLFAPRPPRPKAGWDFPMVAQHWLSSERGQLIWQERQAPASGPITFAPLPAGYKRQSLIDYRVFLGGRGNGRRELRWPGIQYYSISPWELAHPSRVPLTGAWVFPGVRAIVLSWWLVAVISAILPLLWICRAVMWRRRMSKDGATGSVPCPGCGYDIRASLQRCPECGYLAKVDHLVSTNNEKPPTSLAAND